MKISVKQLNLVYQQILERLLCSGIEEIEVTAVYYWTIASDDREDLEKEPDLMIGSLVDDWSELAKLLNGGQVSTVDLERLANILIAASERTYKSKKPLL